jgi:hypothetical protein
VLVLLSVASSQNNYCMGNNPVNAGRCTTCTANDVRISDISRLSGPTTCVIGQTITLDIQVKWSSTANGRYDVASYLARDGGDARTGQCNEFILAPVTTVATAAVPGTQTSPSSGPFLETNGDSCGDSDSSTIVWQKIMSVTIVCRDADKDGVADVSGCTSWNQNQNDNGCQGVATAVCGSPSKCRCDAVLSIGGLGTCLSSQGPCVNDGATQSCNGDQFSARARVTTTATTASTVYPPAAVTTGFLYYNFLASPAQTFAFAFFPPGTAVTAAAPTTPRTDLLSPCRVQRQVTCGTSTSCVAIAEAMLVPRFFREAGDTACGGATCTGASVNPACPLGFRKSGAPTGQSIAFVWTLADGITPCGALAADGPLFEFFLNSGAPGVNLGAPNVLPANTVPFSFAPSTTCTFPRCSIDVELVFVIDEQIALSEAGYQNVLTFVSSIINTFTTTSSRTRFGVYFTASSNATTPPLLLTQNTAAPNLETNVIMPHLHANASSTNFVTSVTAAVNKFWPSASPSTGVAREVLTIVGGPDASNGDYSSVQSLLTARGVQAWALGVEGGASQNAAMAGLSSQATTYQHYEGIWDSSVLALNVGHEGQLLCPQANLCGVGCKGFCSCTQPGVNTCQCPTCASPNCQVSACSNVAVGCVSQPKNCDDHDACTNDSCSIATGSCVNAAIATNATCATCVSSVGCLPPAAACTGNGQGTCASNACFAVTCQGNTCKAGAPVVCDDGNACTQDSCDPKSGCVYTNVPCSSNSLCFPTTCVTGPGAQPNCVVSTTAKTCADGDSCTNDLCAEGVGCTNTNISCPASNVACSFPSGCIGTGATPQCIIGNYSCGFSAAAIAGISAGVIAGVAVAAVIAALLIIFLSKKGYDAYMAKSAFGNSGATNNAAFQDNQHVGSMPESAYARF